jgi:hypothetical protein
MAFEIVWEPKGVYKKMVGSVSAREFMGSIAALQNDPRYDTLRYSINDFLEVDSFQATESDIHLFAATGIGASISNPKIQIAIVATDPQLIEMVKVYAALSPYKVHFFSTLGNARQWASA